MKNIIEKIEELGGIDYENKTLEKLSLLNDRLMGSLTMDFIFFMTNYGGGNFKNRVVTKTIDCIPVTSNGYVSLGILIDYNDRDFDDIFNRIPSDYIPFCEGEPGDYYVIDGNNTVLYWHHESSEDKDIYLVSHTFSDFINDLEVDNSPNEREIISVSLDF